MTNLLKAKRNETVDLTRKETFGILLGRPGMQAELILMKGKEGERQEFIYNIFVNNELSTRVSVSTNEDGRNVGSSNGDLTQLTGYTSARSERFNVAHCDWAYLDPYADHEMPEA